MKDKYPKNYLLLMAVSVFCLIAIVFSSSYAYFKARIVNNTNPFELIGGTIKLQLNENSISGDKLLPILDSQKDTSSQIKNFTVKRTDDSNIDVCYNVYLVIESISDNIKNSKYMKYELTNGSSTTTGNFSTAAYQDGKAIILLAQNKYLSKTNTTGDAYSLKVWLSYDGSVDQTSLLGGNFSAHIYAQGNSGNTCPGSIETKPTLYDKLLSDKSTRPGERTDFSKVLTDNNTNTLYTSTEDSKTVYYFAGNATDNWVKFGKNASNKDLYWRIIRTNSDGGVRLLYHGTSTTTTDAYIGISAFNTTYNNPMYVGYMYGTSGSLVNNRTNANNSTIKTTIDNWYKDNLNTNYGKYISTTAVYCNDRSVTNGTYSTSSSFDYAAYTRLVTNKTPSYDCSVTEDKFTVDTSTGNGKLTYPIALMTADEVSFAGGLYGNNAQTWYYYNSANGSSTGLTWWWLLSPDLWSGSSAFVFRVYGSSNPGYLLNNNVNSANGVRPAVSLKSCVKTSGGDGSASAPYTIEETTSGC